MYVSRVRNALQDLFSARFNSYQADPNSIIAIVTVADGNFVYAQNLAGIIYISPDAPHQHPKILGGAQPVRYAGDVGIHGGKILDITNSCGTFRCDELAGLLAAAQQFVRQGFTIQTNAIRSFPLDGGKPIILG